MWAALIEYYRLGGLNNKHLYLTILRFEKSKIKVPVDPVSSENTHLSLQIVIFMMYPHMAEGRKRDNAFLSISFHNNTNPIHKGSTFIT